MEVESILGTLMLGQVHAAISVSEVETVFVFFLMEFFIVLYLSPADYEFREGDEVFQKKCMACMPIEKCPFDALSRYIGIYIYMSKRSEHTISLSIYLYIYIYIYM